MKDLYDANDKFMVRIPTINKTEIHYTEDELISACKNNIFREKIRIASPDLLNTIDAYMEDKEKFSEKKKKNLFLSIAKYYIRSIERTTPFGLFSGVGIGQFGDLNYFDVNQMEFAKRVSIDTEWLFGYILNLEKKYYRQLKFKLNPVCVQDGNRETLLYTTEDGIDDISVRHTSVFDIVLSVCKEYCIYDHIIKKIQQCYEDVDISIIETYIYELVEKQILISPLRPSLAEENQLTWVLSQCSGLEIEEINDLTYVEKLRQAYENTKIGEGDKEYETLIQYMKNLQESNHYIQVDTYLNGIKVLLDPAIKKKAEHLATALALFSSAAQVQHKYMQQYREKFIEKYGFQREVPILEMLDTAFGIGAPIGYVSPQNDYYEPLDSGDDIPRGVRNYFVSKYEEALRTGGTIKIDLNEMQRYADISEINAESLPLSFELYLYMEKYGDEIRFRLGQSGGSTCAGKTFGRFSTKNQEIAEILVDLNKKEKNLREKMVENCEISFLPPKIRNGNITRCVTGRDLCLSAYTNVPKGTQEIALQDILIGATETQFYAKDAKTGKNIVFGSNNMFNPLLHPNAFRFLLDIANDGKVDWYDFPWKHVYQSCRYIPQIEFEGIILSNEQWFLSIKDLEQRKKITDYNVFAEEFAKYRQTVQLPSVVRITDEDNQITLNLEKPLSLNILYSELKMKKEESLLLERADNGSEITYKNEKSYATEIVVPVFRKKREVTQKIKQYIPYITRNAHIVYPYEDWLYLKLYCKQEREEELIALELKEFGEEINEKYGIEHFFMRYKDPRNHIRLRFYGKDVLLYKAMPEIMKWICQLGEKKIVGDIHIAQYDKEIERYGGNDMIEFAEALFRKDSVIVEDLLQKIRMNEINMSIEEIAITSVLRYVAMFYEGFSEQLDFLTQNYHTSKFLPEFRELKTEYMTLFDIENGWNNFIRDGKRKLIVQMLDSRKDVIDTYKEKIEQKNYDEKYKNDIVTSILHLHCNRLLGADRNLEHKIMAFAESILYSKKHLLKKK